MCTKAKFDKCTAIPHVAPLMRIFIIYTEPSWFAFIKWKITNIRPLGGFTGHSEIKNAMKRKTKPNRKQTERKHRFSNTNSTCGLTHTFPIFLPRKNSHCVCSLWFDNRFGAVNLNSHFDQICHEEVMLWFMEQCISNFKRRTTLNVVLIEHTECAHSKSMAW